MAIRPVFVPTHDEKRLVEERNFEFEWSPGFAAAQKTKNIAALHAAARAAGLSRILEISTKSQEKLGAHLSAFHLTVNIPQVGDVHVENAYQGGKVFRDRGPFVDLYIVHPRQARKDPRLRSSGPLTGFRFGDELWPLEPRSAFYDWLYMKAIYPHRGYLRRLYRYDGFTDIEFNPKKSINCQARACAVFVALMRKGLLDEAMSNSAAFIRILASDADRQPQSLPKQERLL